MNEDAKTDVPNKETNFSKQVGPGGAQAEGAARSQRSVWFGLGMFGLIGWSVAIPTLLGAALGQWVDKHYPGRFSWTLTLLLLGLCSAVSMPGIGSPRNTRRCRRTR